MLADVMQQSTKTSFLIKDLLGDVLVNREETPGDTGNSTLTHFVKYTILNTDLQVAGVSTPSVILAFQKENEVLDSHF
ncbi:hypothetical protein J6590_019376 [Homalodisca vitripennis]|nr:hypothetical protein J6590_019376 [Homalodisca vitripennis]